MPMQTVTLVPGVNVQKTLAANEAGISVSQLIRYKETLVQKLGGWNLYYATPISTTPVRDCHAFMALRNQKFVGFGALGDPTKGQGLQILSCGILTDITPQTRAGSCQIAPSLSISSGSNIVTVTDTYNGGCQLNNYDAVLFNTPIAVGNLLITGCYAIQAAPSTDSFTILSSVVASTTISSGGVLPFFTINAQSAIAQVTLPNNNFQKITGLYYPFLAPTTLTTTGISSTTGASSTITIQGPYSISSIIDSTTFDIGLTVAPISSFSGSTMNGGFGSYTYFCAAGPAVSGGVYGAGNYGSGNYGSGTTPTSIGGTPITATDWILDNSGSTLMAVPRGGGLYVWSPEIGLSQAQIVPTAPVFNFGMFVAQPQQIVVMWGSTQSSGSQDPLLVRWSDVGDYTQWTVLPTTYAGSFKVPTGSTLMGGVQSPIWGAVIWTDVDVWIVQYIGQPLVFSFNRMGTGCGVIGPHAFDINAGNVFWAGFNNFFMMGPSGVQVIPCTCWDYFFQQLDTANATKVRGASNSVFNEIIWFFPIIPSLGGTGENTNYVKLHLEGNEFEWDYGVLSRTAWIDVTALGNPICTDYSGGFSHVYQHDVAGVNDGGGSVINAYLETGYFAIADGEELLFVDWALPDMKWTLAEFGPVQEPSSATILFTFYAVDYAGQPERVYGPFTVTQATTFISPRLRGRLFRMRIESQDLGSFWRIGRIRFRWAPDGRR